MYRTVALTTLALAGLSHGSLQARQAANTTIIEVALDKNSMMSTLVTVPNDEITAVAFGIFQAKMVSMSDSGVSCQVLDSTGTIGGLEGCEPQVFDQGIANSSFLCTVPTPPVQPSTTFQTFVVPTSTPAPNAAPTANVEVDNDQIDLAQVLAVPIDGTPISVDNEVTDIVVNTVSSGANVECKAFSDQAATQQVGKSATLTQEGDLRVDGKPSQVSVITCNAA